ncbi:MAG: imidazole glycerol phosphate synthase subunit HisH [Bdellovibrionales bacterium]|nr:imidazole glycerol phosphate synthase subunit HisH [Bdellovibrionales bacterium]
MKPRITIVDYRIGNLGSIENMLKKLELNYCLGQTPGDIKKSEILILPGVGAFDQGIMNLHKFGLIDPLNEQILHKKTPILGLCLGMHLMTKGSEEGEKRGLGWFDTKAVRFQTDEKKRLKVPHMGWNDVNIREYDHLFRQGEDEHCYYFVHTYYVPIFNEALVLGTTWYGIEFASVIYKDNIFGVQFHPEKSHHFGMRLFRNFCQWACRA